MINSIGQSFKQRVDQSPDAPLIVNEKDEIWTRSRFDALAEEFADRLWAAGARPEERVTVVVHKSPQAFALYLACHYGGYVYHPANIGYTDAELHHLVSDAAPKVIICDPARQGFFKNNCNAAVLTLDASGGGDASEGPAPAVARKTYEPKASDWAALLYTSGTTGKPKGAMLSHGALLSNTRTLIDIWRITEKDVLLHVLPIFHVHGLFVAGNTALCTGYKMLFEPAFDIDRAFELLRGATLFMGVPTHYGRLLSDARLAKASTDNMRLFISGSAPLDAVSSDQFFKKTGHRVLERYGMTETNMLASNPYEGPRRPGSVGRPLPGVSLRLRKEDSALAQTGEAGVVEVKGPNVCMGYLNLPEKTQEAFTSDGYFITGDIGVLDEDGFLTLQGRMSDMIISGGYNVYPREIENALLDFPSIREAVVFGVPHPDFGEGVVACVVAEPDDFKESELIDRSKNVLAAYKTPKRIFQLTELPKNAMGKVDRKALKAEHHALFTAIE